MKQKKIQSLKKTWPAAVLAIALGTATSCTERQSTTGIDETPLSSLSYDLDAEYYYSVYNEAAAQAHDSSSVFDNKDIIIKALTYDQLPYLLQQPGNYLILFGGSWDKETRQAIPYINEYAKAYGVEAVYNLDFRLDGQREATDVENLTNQTLNPYGQPVKADEYNYLYGEIVERYLTNLDRWSAQDSRSDRAVEWVHVDGKSRSRVARLQTPFLFLYNKDHAEGPIRYAVEGFGSDYSRRVQGLFHYLFEQKLTISTYSDGEYFADALIENNIRGHAPKLYDILDRNETIRLEAINYHQLEWLLQQDGNSLILIAGAWCANSTAAFGPINDYAVANDVRVYVFDDRLDGKYPIDFWGYGRDRQFKSRDTRVPGREGERNPNAYLYVDLVNRYLPNIEVIAPDRPIYYLNALGDTISAPFTQSPYFLTYNRSVTDAQGHPAPALQWHEQMLEVNEKNLRPESYLYTPANYKAYTDGIYRVIDAYAQRTGTRAQHYEGSRQRLIDFKYIHVEPRKARKPRQ